MGPQAGLKSSTHRPYLGSRPVTAASELLPTPDLTEPAYQLGEGRVWFMVPLHDKETSGLREQGVDTQGNQAVMESGLETGSLALTPRSH